MQSYTLPPIRNKRKVSCNRCSIAVAPGMGIKQTNGHPGYLCPSCHIGAVIMTAINRRALEVLSEEVEPVIEARVTRGMEYSTCSTVRDLVLNSNEYAVEVAEVLADTIRDLPFSTYEEVIGYVRRTIQETIDTVPACTLATVDYLDAEPTRFYITPERQAEINEVWGA